MRVIVIISLLILPMGQARAMFNDDPWLSKVASEFEYLNEDNQGVFEWDIDAWYGRDINKFWMKSSGEYTNSEFANTNIELVYSKAITAYWDQQFGLRHDLKPNFDGYSRNWVSYGFIGTAPYFIDVDARVFIGEESSSQILIELERELMLTQEWVLTPELDIVANGRSNDRFSEGSGLAEVEFSIRLGYESKGNRKLQPFIGVTATQLFGATKSIARAQGDGSRDISAMIGLHSWF